MKNESIACFLFWSLLAFTTPSHAFDVKDSFSIGGVLAGAIQCLDLSEQSTGVSSSDSTCEGAVPVQPELSWRPTEADEIFVKLGFAAGNALNTNPPLFLATDTSLILAPWAADLEDDVKDINGRSRDYLLTAWYRHTFSFADENRLGVTFGIIDATDYLDENAYANDEYLQFMNEALVNGPNVFLPSYDLGTALEWENGPWSLRGVYMNVGENDDGNEFDFFAAQLGYRVETSLGEGNYRLLIDTTSKEFLDPAGTNRERRDAVLISFDQQFGEVVGGWIRFGRQTDDAAINFGSIYSGGIDIRGARWGRAGDNIGLGCAYLSGGNLEIDKARVVEAYYRWVFNDVLAITGDIQYQRGDFINGDRSEGWVFSIRATAEF